MIEILNFLVIPDGLPLVHKLYLFKKIRECVPDHNKDILCPQIRLKRKVRKETPPKEGDKPVPKKNTNLKKKINNKNTSTPKKINLKKKIDDKMNQKKSEKKTGKKQDDKKSKRKEKPEEILPSCSKQANEENESFVLLRNVCNFCTDF